MGAAALAPVWLGALLVALARAAAAHGADVSIAYGEPPSSFAAVCDVSQPLAFLNVVLENRGDRPLETANLRALDERKELLGERPAPALAPGGSITVSIPLYLSVGAASGLAGGHAMVVRLGGRQTKPFELAFPAALCAPGAPTSVATPAPAGPAPPGVSQRISARSNTGATILAAITPAAPLNVRSVGSGPDCGAHVGAFGALVCPDLMKSGDLLLIWDWRAGAGPEAIDGYRIYRVAGAATQLVGTHAGQEQTLFDVPKAGGAGFAGSCYAVAAYAGKQESSHSALFCAGSASAARTIRLTAVHSRMSYRSHTDPGANFFSNAATFGVDPGQTGTAVGFVYRSEKHAITDSFSNLIYRSAWAFDVSPAIGHALFAAKLQLRIANSEGAGNNHSCATRVGAGTEFWWQSQGWLEGSFGDDLAPTDVGPIVSADVTKIVASWLHGEPNYGFVVRNDDENLDAFTNKECLTVYADPVLEVTFY